MRKWKQIRTVPTDQPIPILFKSWFWAKFTAFIIQVFYGQDVKVEDTGIMVDE